MIVLRTDASLDQMLQNVASDKALHCLLAECTFKIWMKLRITTVRYTTILKLEMDFSNSNRYKWVKVILYMMDQCSVQQPEAGSHLGAKALEKRAS